jgi:hypothetical protein
VDLLAGVRNERESNRAVQACNDYLRLGATRTLRQVEGFSVSQVRKWSAMFGWQQRAVLYDTGIEEQKNSFVGDRRRDVMDSGLGLDFERVAKLKKLAEFLEDQIYETETVTLKAEGEGAEPRQVTRYSRLWLRDYKSIGNTPYEIERFNAALIEQWRGLLDDIAREGGGRKQKQEISGPDGQAISVNVQNEQVDSAISRLGDILKNATPAQRKELLKHYEQFTESGTAFRSMLLKAGSLSASAPDQES